MPLIVDYRPEDFDEMVGNETTLAQVQSKLKSKDCPHSFLLTGDSGCGKTTLARIIAQKLGAFKEWSPHNNLNYTELDSADFRGIDTVRGIRRTMMLSPIAGAKCRVFLLDECHQLTKDAQEALLKALEDTPKHVYFILATTDPQKLKTTLKRRCAHFVLEPVDPVELTEYLEAICESEEKEIPTEVLEEVAEMAQGSPGRSLGLLDSIIDLDEEEMQDQLKARQEQMSEAIQLCRGLINKVAWKKITAILNGLKTADIERTRHAVLQYAASILLKGKPDNRAYLIMDAFREPFYDAPFEQLVLASYECLYAEGG